MSADFCVTSFIPDCIKTTHPHLAQVPVVIVGLILVSQLSAQDDAILPTLETHKHTFFLFLSHCQAASAQSVRAARTQVRHQVALLSQQHWTQPPPAGTYNIS